MALNKRNLQIDLEKAVYQTTGKEYNGKVDKSTRDFCSRLADIIDDYVKSADVIIPANTASVTGTATPAGVVQATNTSIIKGNLL